MYGFELFLSGVNARSSLGIGENFHVSLRR